MRTGPTEASIKKSPIRPERLELQVPDLVARRIQGAQRAAQPKDKEGNPQVKMSPKNLLASLDKEGDRPRKPDMGPTEGKEE